MSVEKLRTAIQLRIEEGKQPVLLECEVLKVDKKSETCDVIHIDSGIEYFDVQLRPWEVDKMGLGITVFPKKGCLCTVAIVDLISTSPMFVNCGEIESIVLKMPGLELSADEKGLVLNGGENGGLVLVKKLLVKINTLELNHNALADYVSALVLPVSGVSAGPPVVPASITKILTQTKESEISNSKIKH